MRNRLIFISLVLILPLLLMVVVNEFAPVSTHQPNVRLCTRYCHDANCFHWQSKPLSFVGINADQLYTQTILALRNNPFGLSYAAMNIWVYVVFTPLLTLLMFWGLIRKRT